MSGQSNHSLNALEKEICISARTNYAMVGLETCVSLYLRIRRLVSKGRSNPQVKHFAVLHRTTSGSCFFTCRGNKPRGGKGRSDLPPGVGLTEKQTSQNLRRETALSMRAHCRSLNPR